MKKMQIKIELISDLCPASGEGVAGIIDNDVNFDEWGIPYIPSKRVKGCLREVGSEINDLLDGKAESTFNKVFGKAGDVEGGKLRISNGRIENYEMVVEFLANTIDGNTYNIFNKEYIKEFYTSVRTQTRIDSSSGAAQHDTLRATRVINRGNSFYFDIEVEGKEEIDFLKQCCSGLRNLGLNRTRGYGEVNCQLMETENTPSGLNEAALECREDSWVLEYVLKLESQIIISGMGSGDGSTDDYVAGSAVLGYFANRFLVGKNKKEKSQAHENKLFRDLFLSNKVRYSNAYITEHHNNKYLDYFPTPLSVVKEKNKENYYIDNHPDVGEQTKSIGNYIHFTNSEEFYHKIVETEIVYHHQRPKDRSIGHALGTKDNRTDLGEFYQYEVLKENQYFKGRIFGNKEELEEIIKLIPIDKRITLGKSKTAQYAKGRFVHLAIKTKGEYLEEVEEYCEIDILEPNTIYTLQLTSPMVLVNTMGHCTPDIQILEEELRKIEPSIILLGSTLKYKTIAGFNSKWMLPKPKVLALDSGSTVSFEYTDDRELHASLIINKGYGLRQNEGLGMLSFIPMKDNGSLELESKEIYKRRFNYIDAPVEIHEMIKFIFKRILTQQLKDRAIQLYNQEQSISPLSNSFANKIYLILEESSSIVKFTEDIYKIYEKDSHKNQVENILKILYDEKHSKILEIYKESAQNECNGSNLSKEAMNNISEITKELFDSTLGQCDIDRKINSMNKNMYDDLLNITIKNLDHYMKIYFKSILQHVIQAKRKED